MKQLGTKTSKIGRIGEDLAVRFLMKQGFSIIERNYLRKWGELDVVACKESVVHFVEVKCVSWETETSNVSRETNQIRPEEHVTREKLKRLSRVIQTYLVDKDVPRETKFQLDVVTVKLNLKDKTARIGVIENVL
ncbi:MAG: hypothetical protein AMXMBFR44_2430 [Candidatus Campbellbacteria bacterium]